jgi:hypothetical protein
MMVKSVLTLRSTPFSTGASRTFRYLPLIALLLLGFFSQDQPVYFFGVFIFISLFYTLLNTQAPPVILFAFVFEWFFNQGQLFQAIFMGLSVVDLPDYRKNVGDTIMLGLIGTAVFFLGIFLVTRKTKVLSFADIEQFFRKVNLENLLRFYIVAYALLLIFGNYIWVVPGLAQPFLMLTYFRWAVFFLLFCTVYVQGRYRGVLILLILCDFLLGFLTFFSNFKEVIYFSFISYWIFYFRSSRLARVLLGVTFIFAIYLGALWSHVKDDYRDFLNEGTGSQVVRVGRAEALNKFIDLTRNVSAKELNEGFDQLILRLSWIGAFNRVHNHVPAKVPFQDGKLWREGLSRPFMPRVFFPEKTGLSDSKELNYYSGLTVDEKNTSISLSMVAGSYVDFGPVGMQVVLFLFGLFCGYVFKKAIEWGRYVMVGYALTMPMIYLLLINEQSISRTISSVVLYLLVLWFTKKFLLDSFLSYILPKRSSKASMNGHQLG